MIYRNLEEGEIIEPTDEVKPHGDNFPGEGWSIVPEESVGEKMPRIHVGYYRRPVGTT